MRKRFLSLLCVLALCLGLLPVTALAAEGAPNTLYVGNQNVKSGEDTTYWATTDNGELELVEGASDTSNNWNVKYDPSTATLTLNGATINGAHDATSLPYGSGIYALCSSNQSVALTIELIGTNTITGNYGIYVDAQQGETVGTNASLLIQNSSDYGILEVSGSSHGIYVKSGTGNASLTIKDASVVASSSSSYDGYAGVCVQSGSDATSSPKLSLAVDGGSLTTSASEGNDGIQFYVGAHGVTSETTSLSVTKNAIVDARNGGISASGVSVNPNVNIGSTDSTGGIVWNGSEGTVYGDVELLKDLEIKSGETLTIPEGSSLNANGKLTNNGTILASGGTVSGNLSDGSTVTTPSISQQPTGQTVTEDTQATFSVTASDAQIYQWQQSTDSGSNWANIESATSAKYTTEATTTSMSGYQYRCVVKSASGVSVISQAATLTVQAKPASVPVTGVKLNTETLELFTGNTATLTATVQPDDATNKNVTWQSDNANVATVQNGTVNAVGAGEATITVTTEDGKKTATCTVTVEKPYTPPPYIPPTKTPSQQAIDKIEDAKEGSTVKITLRTGQTKLDKEVFEELAGRDVTLEISLPGGVTWTVNGEDIPQTADLTDLDMGVSLNTSDIPVDVINMVTGEKSTVQLSLAHDGEFGFTLTLTAPVGTENKGLWANLYHYNTTKKQMLFEASAQVDSSGNVALKFTHASEYAIVLDESSHELPFTDTAKGAWYQGAVEYVYRNGIMTGTSATTFEPNAPLSRAMVAQILYNLEGQPAVEGESTFTDASTHWAVDAITWAQETGVVNGYEDNTFRPNRAVTREELAQMLYNYAKVKGYDLTTSGDLTAFPDGSKVSSWAKEAMAWANGNKLINGFEDDTLRPGGDSTRAQAASILMNFDVNLAN